MFPCDILNNILISEGRGDHFYESFSLNSPPLQAPITRKTGKIVEKILRLSISLYNSKLSIVVW